jgi:outer membrane protein OmpA-like peptidoglycan-associated protein
MKKLYLSLVFVCLYALSYSQMRMAIIGGPHSASVKETNSLPDWETTIKPNYSSRPGLNLGVLIDIPLSSTATRWSLQPGLLYMAKGRKFFMRNDSTASELTDTVTASRNLAVNYIDVPFNIAYKLPLGKKAKFILSAGPYVGFFYNGKQKFETRIYSSNDFKNDEQKLETGTGEGKINTIDAGVNARAGFEIGSLLLTGFMSQGLTNFYNAPYEGKFNHQVRGVSVGFWLNKVKQAPKPPKDTDNDGVPDNVDACPKLAGPAITNGCPDTDDDGIADNKDKCPNVPGASKYEGCPVPDTDNDGMNDETDACPTVAGVVEFNGCPVPDSDGDGLNDQADKCPTEAGPETNGGCPVKEEIKQEVREKAAFAAKNIFFKASSAELTQDSYGALDDVVTLLRENENLKMNIEGHTDSTGSAQLNAKLSQSRADAVKNYLISKGIAASRLQSTGYGSSRPLVSNETVEGRRKNRRVELKLVQ